jgi:hypothetical protein
MSVSVSTPASQIKQTPDKIIAEQAADYGRELRRLSSLAFVFLSAADGDPAEAERQLDNTVDLLLEGGCLSTWRYRVLLAEIREGGR